MSRKAGAFVTALVLFGGAAGAAHAEATPAGQVAAKTTPRWSGSSVSLEHYVSMLTFDRSAEPDYNPYVAQSINLDPAWRLTDQISLSGHLDISTELTDSDVTTYNQEPLLSDLRVGGSYKLPPLPKELKASAGLNLTLPTSKESQARRRVFGLSGSFRVSRSWKVDGGIELTPSMSLSAGFTAARAHSLQYEAPTIVTCPTDFANCEEFDHSGVRSSVGSFQQQLALDASFPHRLSARLSLLWGQSLLYSLDTIVNPVSGEPIPESDTNTDWRYLMGYTIGGEWSPMDHVSVGLAFVTYNPQQKPDSSYYAPFFNRYTQLLVSAGYQF